MALQIIVAAVAMDKEEVEIILNQEITLPRQIRVEASNSFNNNSSNNKKTKPLHKRQMIKLH